MRRLLALVAVSLPVPAALVGAQSARPLSIQVSGLFAALLGDAYRNLNNGVGAELQIRHTSGRLSLGGGLEYTRHGLDAQVATNPVHRFGPFVEPRLVIPTASNSVAPYLAARLSVLRVSYKDRATDLSQSATGFTLNGGGGFLIRMGPRTNLDLGATFGHTRFGDLTTSGSGGQSSVSLGSGSNIIVRAGVTVGL